MDDKAAPDAGVSHGAQPPLRLRRVGEKHAQDLHQHQVGKTGSGDGRSKAQVDAALGSQKIKQAGECHRTRLFGAYVNEWRQMTKQHVASVA
jgi:hypothetical protein